MNALNTNQYDIVGDELYVAILQGPGSSGKTTTAKGLEALGFETIGLGTFYRSVCSLYISENPDQVDVFDRARFDSFLESEADVVQEVMRGQTSAPHKDLKDPAIQSTVSFVGESPRSQDLVNDYACELLSERTGLIFMEGRALDIILPARNLGKHVVANFFIDVSPELAAERNVFQAEDKGLYLDYEQELAKIKARNKQDAERPVNPMILPPDAVTIETNVNDARANTIGERAVAHARVLKKPVPRCVHLKTDELFPSDTQRISQAVVMGALSMVAPRSIRSTVVR